MQEIDALVQKIKELDTETTALEAELKNKTAEFKKLKDVDLPTVMILNNVQEYSDLTGTKVSFKMDYRASSAEDRVPDILSFLGKHNAASVYRKVVTIEMPYEPQGLIPNDWGKLEQTLQEAGVPYKEADKALPQSLDAVVRRLYPELDEADKAKANEVLKVTEYFKTTIKG